MIWYVVLSGWAAYEPADRQFWLLSSLLPTLFVVLLIGTCRYLPLSPLSYVFIAAFLTLHTMGVHYTYAEMPMGDWVNRVLHMGRNHYDRVVHFSFGFLLTYPLEELFRLTGTLRGWLVYYLPVMTILGLSGLWEIIESWVARIAHPDLGITYLGSQGDIWDAQKDMTAALYGSLLCMTILLLWRLRGSRSSEAEPLADVLN
ncbi:membrane protein [Nitrospira sp.]|nr:membrane protein [Nitrospira sp.]